MGLTKETLMQCSAKRRELQQIDKRIKQLQEDARSTKAVCYSSEPKGRGEPIAAVQRYIERAGRTVEPVTKKRSRTDAGHYRCGTCHF